MLSSCSLAASPPSLQNQCGQEVNRATGALTAGGRGPVHVGHVDDAGTGWTTGARQSPRLGSASNLPNGTTQSHNFSASVSLSVESKCSVDLSFPKAILQARGKAFPSNQRQICSTEKTTLCPTSEVWNSLSFIERDVCNVSHSSFSAVLFSKVRNQHP